MTCCNNSNIIESDGFYVCNNCGTCGEPIIIDSLIHLRRNTVSRILESKEIVVHKFGNRTIMYAKEAKESGMFHLFRLNKQDFGLKYGWSMKYSIPIFNTVCFKMGIPIYIRDYALKLYTDYIKSGKNMPIEAGIAAVLIISSIVHNVSISIKELIDILDCSRDKVFMYIEKISSLLIT